MFRMWEYVEYPDLSYNPVNPDRVTQLEIFTLTLTLSLKGEGIAELRKSNPDSDNARGWT